MTAAGTFFAGLCLGLLVAAFGAVGDSIIERWLAWSLALLAGAMAAVLFFGAVVGRVVS